jgi:hypothetical protein
MVTVQMEEINRVTDKNVFITGSRILLPVGTIFELDVAELGQTVYVNPMANVELQYLHNKPYYVMEFGGKHPEQFPFTLGGDKAAILQELKEQFPQLIGNDDDLHIVRAADAVKIHLGGNNKNIIEEIKTLYMSPELAGHVENISFEHHFFFDVHHPKFKIIENLYRPLDVSVGDTEDMHVEGLLPRVSYVINIIGEDGNTLDRIILSNKINEEIIPPDQLRKKYFGIEYKLRRDHNFVETHLVLSSMTNHEEIRLLVRLLQTAHASGVITYFCPTLTLLKGLDRLVTEKYYAVENERFYEYRQDFICSAILPYINYAILNRDELILLDNSTTKRGIDAMATFLAHQMNSGRKGEQAEGGKVVITGGSRGARYTEIMRPERARLFWKKARLADDKPVRYANRRIVCGDDYLTSFSSTLGAGDVFTGILIGLSAIDWDGGHALRAATLGAQHFILSRTKPQIREIITMDEHHIRMGTETELVDVISHHVAETGDPTRYGTITKTDITVTTTQIQHPFREVLALARTIAAKQAG